MLNQTLAEQLHSALQTTSKITFLVGAGISADSGIPTFRGKEGYWTIGSKNYHPQEMATNRMFQINAEEVWKWYLYRKGVVENANPNPSHFLLKELEELLHSQFALVTQNVDGLHKRVGSSPDKLFSIHGDLNYVRCGDTCTNELYPFPDGFDWKNRNQSTITETELKLLTCPKCGELLRPHVLWFDEYYNEHYYKFDSAMKIAGESRILFILGTSGVTNLPMLIAEDVLYNKGFVVEVYTDESHFTHLLTNRSNGLIIREKSSVFLDGLVNHLRNHHSLPRRNSHN